jgi:brefeldin A-resistance guanine nucleotide exchange factor 1
MIKFLQLFLLLNKTVKFFFLQVARQVAFGMYEMLRNNAANIHETSDWEVVFAVIEIVGAGASPDDQVQHLHLQNHELKEER